MATEYRIMLLTGVDLWEEVDPHSRDQGYRVLVAGSPPAGRLQSVEDCRRAIDDMIRTSTSLEPGAFRIEQRTITDWTEIDLVPDCPHYFPHTRAWCGTSGCPE